LTLRAAEHALALLLAVSKQIVAGDRAVRAGEWPRDLIEPVRGKTIGILGLGRIGRSMAIESANNVITLHQGQWPAGAVINTQLQGKWSW